MDRKRLYLIFLPIKLDQYFDILKSLHHASSKGHLKIVQKLLRLGADPSLYTSDYMYAFDLAENAGYSNVALKFTKINFIFDNYF